jgi:hypothetical protein
MVKIPEIPCSKLSMMNRQNLQPEAHPKARNYIHRSKERSKTLKTLHQIHRTKGTTS